MRESKIVDVKLPARRSCLSVPASSPRKLEKAAKTDVDEVILDLEDAVVADAKDAARELAVTHLADAAAVWRCGTVAVRVNAARTPWAHRDLVALATLPATPNSVIVPKVESAGDLAFVERLLDGAEAERGRERPLRVQALIETAAGLARVGEIAAASPRLDALVLGYADLAASLGRSREAARRPDAWLAAQDRVLLAARAHGLQAIDGPHLGIEVNEPFEAAVAHARGLGFDGKWAIHPSQVSALREAFTPSAEEVERARTVVVALQRAEREGGAGAVALDGEMLDEALRVAALRVLARAGEAPAP